MQTKSAMPHACLVAAILLASGSAAGADWTLDHLIPGGPFKGIHGLGVGPDGLIYVGSVVGQTLHTVNPETGEHFCMTWLGGFTNFIKICDESAAKGYEGFILR